MPIGGHTPYEPALYSSTIIHGQYFSNFDEIYTKLNNNSGAIKANNPLQISSAWEKLRDKEYRKKTILIANNILVGSNRKKELITSILEKLKP